MRMPEWIDSFDGTRAALARLKNLTSDLIGRFARAATTATREAYATSVLTRYRAHVVVPRVVEAEMAVLKGIIGAAVVSIEGRKGLYKEQRRVLKRLATALWERPDALDALHAEDFAAAETDAARRRVVVDQVASLTDQLAIAWHGRLVGEVDAASVGVWAPGLAAAAGARRRRAVRGALMAGRIRQADVDEVKARTNIADIIGERVALKTAGVGAMKGLCPFHDERSPSFNVRPQAGFYHCFGCGESGDVYSFLAQDGPRLVHRGGRAPRRPHRLHAALRGRRSGPRAQRAHAAVRRERRRGGVLPRASSRPPRPTPRGASSASAASTPARPRTSASATRRRAGRACTRRCARRASPTRSSARRDSSRRGSAASTTDSAAASSGRSATSPAR